VPGGLHVKQKTFYFNIKCNVNIGCEKCNKFPVEQAAGWIGSGEGRSLEKFQDEETARFITERHETAP
jgi:hypothetical protein